MSSRKILQNLVISCTVHVYRSCAINKVKYKIKSVIGNFVVPTKMVYKIKQLLKSGKILLSR